MTREEIEKQCAEVKARYKVGLLAQQYEIEVKTPFGDPARVRFWISPGDLKTFADCLNMAAWPNGVQMNILDVDQECGK